MDGHGLDFWKASFAAVLRSMRPDAVRATPGSVGIVVDVLGVGRDSARVLVPALDRGEEGAWDVLRGLPMLGVRMPDRGDSERVSTPDSEEADRVPLPDPMLERAEYERALAACDRLALRARPDGPLNRAYTPNGSSNAVRNSRSAR